MNHHDTPHPTPTALCARVAPLLPALDEWGELSVLTLAGDAPSSDELALTHAHLATCAYCQAQRAAYARLDVALHGAVGMRAIAPLRTADIMAGLLRSQPNTLPISAELGAEIAPTPTIVAATMIAAPVTQADAPTRAPSPSDAPPSGRDRRASLPRKRRLPAWLATVAAALVVALLAAGIVRSVGARVGGGFVGATASPTSTTSAHSVSLFNGQEPALTNITMVSATEGWAIGPSQPGKPSLIYHLRDNAWTPVTLTGAARRVAISTPSALAFASPTDGWAFFSQASKALHYDGHSWQAPVSTFTSESAITCNVRAFQWVTPTDGWGACANPTPDNQSLLHYDGHAWSTMALPAGLNTTLDAKHTIILNTETTLTDLSMVSATDGWAVGYVAGSSANPNQQVIGFILQYTNGQWTVSLKRYDYEFRTVSALATGDVWVGGDQVKYQGGVGANKYTQIASTPILLHAQGGLVNSIQPVINQPGYFTVEVWSSTSLPLPRLDPALTTVGTLTQVVMRSPTDGWALGNEVSQSHYKSGPQLTAISYLLLHYDGVRWQPSNPLATDSQSLTVHLIAELGVASNGDCWAVGLGDHDQHGKAVDGPGILGYHDGVWKVYLG